MQEIISSPELNNNDSNNNNNDNNDNNDNSRPAGSDGRPGSSESRTANFESRTAGSEGRPGSSGGGRPNSRGPKISGLSSSSDLVNVNANEGSPPVQLTTNFVRTTSRPNSASVAEKLAAEKRKQVLQQLAVLKKTVAAENKATSPRVCC